MLKTLRPGHLRDTVCVVVGTRPGIVKQSPLIRELARRGLPYFVLHTGQHYSDDMDASFFRDLDLPEPEYRLTEPMKCSLHGEQTAAMLTGSERVFLDERPRLVLVGGDANTNLATALAARKLHIGVAHVEAGLRSFDWRMPEEHNRVMIDHISDWMFAPNENARQTLEREHVRGRIEVVGNTVVDALYQHRDLAAWKSTILEREHLAPDHYLLLTLHREENVDDRDTLGSVLDAIAMLRSHTDMPVVFAAHPRTRRRLDEFGLLDSVGQMVNLRLIPPAGYLDFLHLLSSARLLMTDSGGVQQEACIVRTPCVTLREVTEWTETVDIGANVLAGTDPSRIVGSIDLMLQAETSWPNPFGDGHAAARIIDLVCGAYQPSMSMAAI